MLEIATCSYAKIYFKIRRRTLSGCHSESYIMQYTFIKGLNSDQLQFQQNTCYNITKCNLFIFKNWLQNLPPNFVRLLLWVIHHPIHISKGFQEWSATISAKPMLEIETCLYAKIYFKICRRTSSGFYSESYIMRYTFIKGFNSDQLQSHQNRCYNLTKCNLLIFKNWLQNLLPDFVELLQWVVHHAIHISKRFQQWSATISPKQMLEIATCLYAKIYFKMCRRTSSGCHSESYIMRYTFIKGFNSDQLQFQQNRCYKITKCYLFICKN
jgi:hypothetical protein